MIQGIYAAHHDGLMTAFPLACRPHPLAARPGPPSPETAS